MTITLRHAALAALIGIVPATHPHAIDGYVYTERLTTDGEVAPLTLHIKVAQGRVRINLFGGPNSDPAPTYMVLRDDGKVALIDSLNKRAVLMDPGAMAGGPQGSAANATTEVSGVNAQVTDLGAGEEIIGHATHKYHVRQRYTATVKVGGDIHASTLDVVSELWIATDVPGYTEGLKQFAEAFGGAFTGVAGGSAPALIESTKDRIPATGFALKSVVSSLNTDEYGRRKTTKTTVEVLSIAKAPATMTEFDLPPGFAVMDISTPRGRGKQ